jgi:hypothetical protein
MTTPEGNDKDGPVHPPVIDIEAEDVTPSPDVESEKTTAYGAHAEAAPPPLPPKRRSHGWRNLGLLILVIAALAAGAWLYKDYGQRFWPSDIFTTLANRVATLEASNKTLGDQLTSLGGTIDTLKADEAAQNDSLVGVDQRSKQAQGEIAALKETVGSTDSRFAQAESAIGELRLALEALKQSITTAGDNLTVTAPDPAALTALSQRLDALEGEVASLKTEINKGGDGAETAALISQTLADLKAKFTTGAPYQDELDRIARLVPAAPGADRLTPYAATGLPDAQALAGELGTLIASLPAPAGETETEAEKDYWDYLVDLLGSFVTIRVVGETDWRDVAERARAYAETNDLPAAISLIERAGGEPPAALAAWRTRAQARLDGEAALAELSTAVLRQLAAEGSTP